MHPFSICSYIVNEKSTPSTIDCSFLNVAWYKPIMSRGCERDLYESEKLNKGSIKKVDDIVVIFTTRLLKFAWEGMWELQNQWTIRKSGGFSQSERNNSNISDCQ